MLQFITVVVVVVVAAATAEIRPKRQSFLVECSIDDQAKSGSCAGWSGNKG